MLSALLLAGLTGPSLLFPTVSSAPSPRPTVAQALAAGRAVDASTGLPVVSETEMLTAAPETLPRHAVVEMMGVQPEQTASICDYNHSYDISLPALHGFNTALGTLQEVHIDAVLSAPDYVVIENTLSNPIVVHLGQHQIAGTPNFEDAVGFNGGHGWWAQVALYYKVTYPSCGDGTEILLGTIDKNIAPNTITLAAYDGTTDGAGVSGYTFVGTYDQAEIDDLAVLTDSASLCVFTGASTEIRLKDRMFSETSIESFYSVGYEFQQDCHNVTVFARYVY